MDIRKIAIGPDYKTAMHYVIGQPVLGDHTIEHIRNEPTGDISLWVKKNKEIFCWKRFTKTIPMVIEYNIKF